MEREKSMEKIKCPRCNADCEVEEIIDYDDYRIVAEDGVVTHIFVLNVTVTFKCLLMINKIINK